MPKDGENYLDELLNAVAPNWEESSSSPEPEEEDVSLEDALSALENIPEEMLESEEDDSENPEENMEEFMGMLSDLEDVEGTSEEEPEMEEESEPEPEPEPEELMETMEDTVLEESPEEESGEEEPDLDSLLTDDFLAEMEEQLGEEPSEESEPEPVETVEDTMPEENTEEEEPDLDGLLTDDFLAEMEQQLEAEPSEEPKSESEPAESESLSEETMAVDDVFQSALSAVGYNEGDEDIFSLDDISLEPDSMEDYSDDNVTSVPVLDPSEEIPEIVNGRKKKKKPGFFAKIFGNIITEQTAEEEERERQEEEELKVKKAAEKEEKKKQAEIDKEEKAQLAQEQKERKNQLKAEKAAEKAEKKAEKKRLKAERDAEAAKEVVGKINPIGATIVFIFFATIFLFTAVGAPLLSRNLSLNSAQNYFANGEFIEAYDTISSVNIREDDEELYRRIRICSQMQKEINSYTNYVSMDKQLEALDALIKGIHYYDKNSAEAEKLGVMGQFNGLESQLASSLYNDYGLSESQARELLALEDRVEYTRRLEEIVGRNQ